LIAVDSSVYVNDAFVVPGAEPPKHNPVVLSVVFDAAFPKDFPAPKDGAVDHAVPS
jgi:hypothetical protein